MQLLLERAATLARQGQICGGLPVSSDKPSNGDHLTEVFLEPLLSINAIQTVREQLPDLVLVLRKRLQSVLLVLNALQRRVPSLARSRSRATTFVQQGWLGRLLVQVLMLTKFLRVVRVEARGRLRVTSTGALLLLEGSVQLLELSLLMRFHDVEALVVVCKDLEVGSLIDDVNVFVDYLTRECHTT